MGRGFNYSITITEGNHKYILNELDYALKDDIVDCLNSTTPKLKAILKDEYGDIKLDKKWIKQCAKFFINEDWYGYKPIKLTKSKANILIDKLRNNLIEIENGSYHISVLDRRIAKLREAHKKESKKYIKKYGILKGYIKVYSTLSRRPFLGSKNSELSEIKSEIGSNKLLKWAEKRTVKSRIKRIRNKEDRNYIYRDLIKEQQVLIDMTKSLITELERLTKNKSFSKSKISLKIDGGDDHYLSVDVENIRYSEEKGNVKNRSYHWFQDCKYHKYACSTCSRRFAKICSCKKRINEHNRFDWEHIPNKKDLQDIACPYCSSVEIKSQLNLKGFDQFSTEI